MKKILKKTWVIDLLLVFLFGLTRYLIWIYRPAEFTEIIYSYMPYAHLWASGTIPYLTQWYEYPPATIPLFYLPHLIDMKTLAYEWHIHYLTAYRAIMLLIDAGIFGLIYAFLKKFKVGKGIFVSALMFYSLSTLKAHNFIYDSMDLAFAGAMVLAVAVPWLKPSFGGGLIGWIGYFLAAGLKLINIPLGLVYAGLERRDIKLLALKVILAGAMVWLLPLAFFRSSLSVMLVYHAQRGLQVESVPAQAAALINRVTKSEKYEEKFKNYDITGPVSSQIKRGFDWLFPLAILVYIVWGTKTAWNSKAQHQPRLKLSLTIGYVYCFMLFSKILSTPFLLWQLPLLALYPFNSLKRQWIFLLPAAIMIGISMTKIPNIPLGILNLHLLIGLVRSGLIAYLLWQSVRLVKRVNGGSRI